MLSITSIKKLWRTLWRRKNDTSDLSQAPQDGQLALDQSVAIGKNSATRLGVSCGEFVILRLSSVDGYHGFVITKDEVIRNDIFILPLKRLEALGFITPDWEVIS